MNSDNDSPRPVSRRTALKKGFLVSSATAVGIPVLSGTALAATITVPDDYSTIQTAVDNASSGDTVVVDGGTYREQVLIDKDLTLQGENGPTIEALDSLTTYTVVESLSTWAPMVFAYGGSISSGEVSGSGTIGVSISGFEFDGRGDTGQAGRKTALLNRNVRGASSAAKISDNSVVNMSTPGNSIGIVAYGDSDVIVENNTLSEFGRGGIGANGDGGIHPSPNMVVRNNVIDADSEAGGSAPNGVQIGFGATGAVKENTIKNCRYADDLTGLFQSSGVLVFESDTVDVKKNTLENNDVAVASSAWGWFLSSANGNKIIQNDISDALIGVNPRATAWDQDGRLSFFTNRDPEVVNNKVVNNDIDDPTGGPEGTYGIAIDSNDKNTDDSFEPVVRNNKVIRNSITGFETDIFDEGTETKSEANVIEP